MPGHLDFSNMVEAVEELARIADGMAALPAAAGGLAFQPQQLLQQQRCFEEEGEDGAPAAEGRCLVD